MQNVEDVHLIGMKLYLPLTGDMSVNIVCSLMCFNSYTCWDRLSVTDFYFNFHLHILQWLIKFIFIYLSKML